MTRRFLTLYWVDHSDIGLKGIVGNVIAYKLIKLNLCDSVWSSTKKLRLSMGQECHMTNKVYSVLYVCMHV